MVRSSSRGLRDDARDRVPLAKEAGHPHPLPHLDSRVAGGVEERLVEGQAAHREAGPVPVPAPVLAPERRSVRRDELHAAQGVGRESAHPIGCAHCVEEPPGLGGNALAADLVPGEARGVEEEHVVPALREEAGHGRAGGPAPDHDHVAPLFAHERPPASRAATTRRR